MIERLISDITFPYYQGDYILRSFINDDVCPFPLRTGYVDYSNFSPNTVIEFVSEKDNPVDKKAVKVIADGQFIGYLYQSSLVRRMILDRTKNKIKYIAHPTELKDTGKMKVLVGFYSPFAETEAEKLDLFEIHVKGVAYPEYINSLIGIDRAIYAFGYEIKLLPDGPVIGRISKKGDKYFENENPDDFIGQITDVEKDQMGRSFYKAVFYKKKDQYKLHKLKL